MLGTTMRMRGMADQEETLIGYERFVGVYDLDFASNAETQMLHQELAARLESLHPRGRAPLHQSLRGGTQAAGTLFERQLPVLTRLRERIAAAVCQYIDELHGIDHPFTARCSGAFTLCGILRSCEVAFDLLPA